MTRTVFITGSSSGFGKAAAEKFHDAGWNVVATLRNPDDWKAAPSDRLYVHPLDMTGPQGLGRVHVTLDGLAVDTAAPSATRRSPWSPRSHLLSTSFTWTTDTSLNATGHLLGARCRSGARPEVLDLGGP